MKKAKLILKDGSTIEGDSFGASVSSAGEVVFNTGMVGYVETLTDPSYAGQILVLTYPLVGNYGVPSSKKFESEKIQVAGLIVSEYSEKYSHHEAKESLSEWLKRSKVPALTGVDTRALTKKLRTHGVMLGQISVNGKKKGFVDPNKENLVAKVSIAKKKTYPAVVGGRGKPVRIVAVDCGMKENIARSLTARGATVLRVPWNYDFTKEDYDGLFISNGPGDPTMCTATIAHIADALKRKKPILGICLGTQLMALAAGAKTFKLKYGHRSQNQPCIDMRNGTRPASAKASAGRCYITSQNHGFAIDEKTLPKEWKVWFKNANDGSVEGIRHTKLPFRSVQFHPEASPGPVDTAWVFDDFLKEVRSHKKKTEKKHA